MDAETRRTLYVLIGLLAALYLSTLLILEPLSRPTNDAPTYIASADVLAGGSPNADFMINRILTSPLTLISISIFTYVSGNPYVGWLTLNTVFFFALGLVSFLFLRRLFHPFSAALGTYLICANYDVLTFGIRPLSDIGGWFFYMLALYFLAGFTTSSSYRQLIYAALAIGIGGLFKEYAFVAIIPFAAVALFEWGRNPIELIKRTIVPALCAVVPALITHAAVFLSYHYTYLDWYQYNNHLYGYQNWIAQTIKSFGVVLSLVAIPALGGLFLFFKEFRLDRRAIFILSLCIPAVCVLLWPSITQRVVFLAVPTAVVFSCILFDRFQKLIPLWVGLAALYTLISLSVDSYLLDAINLPF